MLNKDNEKIELTPTQQNPGNAKPEDFVIGNEGNPGGGQFGDTLSERKKLLKKREENRPAWTGTPERNDVNKAEKPKSGSHLG
jgi:hypothetical protein